MDSEEIIGLLYAKSGCGQPVHIVEFCGFLFFAHDGQRHPVDSWDHDKIWFQDQRGYRTPYFFVHPNCASKWLKEHYPELEI